VHTGDVVFLLYHGVNPVKRNVQMASSTLAPVVLFVNCLDSPSSSASSSPVHPLNLLKDVPNLTLSENNKNLAGLDDEPIRDWTIDNKYYTAQVHVVVVPSPLLPGTPNPVLDAENGLADRVEAIILCCGGGGDGKKLSKASFNLVKHWLPFVDRCAPPVRIAVCEGFDEEEEAEVERGEDCIKFAEAIEWCIENQFELVQFEGEEEEDDDEEDDDEEEDDDDSESFGVGKPFASGEFGVPRILAALNAHMWSNLTMKGTKLIAKESSKEEEGTVESVQSVTKEEKTKESTTAVEEDKLEAMFGDFELSGDGADDEESFEQLFNKMANLKSQSQNLQFEDRKAFAEQVTMAFWRAIGGDEDELQGLDDDVV